VTLLDLQDAVTGHKIQPMSVPFVDLKAQYESLASEVERAISAVLIRGDFVLGKEVAQFEEEFAAYCEAAYAVGVDSGTSALKLALRAFDIGAGDEVITAANTFVATALAISYTGARPVLVDVDPHTNTIDVSLLKSAITRRTRAIIPVHLYGHPADMDPILDIARKHDLVVIEDACQAHGARYDGKRVGSLGNAAAFSFYPAKNLGAYGDGGMVVTGDERVAQSVRLLRDYGQSEKYHHVLIGYNHRLDTLQAAVLSVKLKYLDEWNDARHRHAELYGRFLAHGPAVLPTEAEYGKSVFHLYVIRIQDRDRLRAFLHSKGIATGMHYPIPIHMQPAYRHLGHEKGSFPVTEERAEQQLSLPMYAELTPDSIEYVAKAIRDFAVNRSNEELRRWQTDG
jgi:dTDP-4-amino-4,6-dideoxygalactose transaminase